MFNQSVLSDATTPVDSPDPDLSTLKVCGWQLVVRPLHIEGKTKSGILLTNKHQDDAQYLMNVCKVLKMGSQCYTQEGFEGERWCEVGDYIMLPKNVGQKVSFKGYPLTFVNCDRVMAVIKDPKDIDPMYNLCTASYEV